MNGLRISEALGADIEDLDTERGHRTLKILRKGGKHVTIPVAPRTARSLDLYIGERCTGPIFVAASDLRMDRYAADRTVKRLARRAGIVKRISPHSLRHSFITAALDAGVPRRDVQEAASHADPRTTMRYDRAPKSSTVTPLTSLPRSSLARPAATDIGVPASLAFPSAGTLLWLLCAHRYAGFSLPSCGVLPAFGLCSHHV
jgi:integrase